MVPLTYLNGELWKPYMKIHSCVNVVNEIHGVNVVIHHSHQCLIYNTFPSMATIKNMPHLKLC